MASKKKQPGKREGLTPKQRAFVEAYTGDAKGNGTVAARMAGYKGNDVTLAAVATENLKKPQVQAAIAAATRQVSSAAIATRRERQTFFTSVMRGEECRELVLTAFGKPIINKNTGEPMMTPPPAKERLKAGELLGRMQGDFIERVEVRAEESLRKALVGLRTVMKGAAWTFEQIAEHFAGGE